MFKFLVVLSSLILILGCSKSNGEKAVGDNSSSAKKPSIASSGSVDERIMEVIKVLQVGDIKAYFDKGNIRGLINDECLKTYANSSAPDFEKKSLIDKCNGEDGPRRYDPIYKSDVFKKTAKYEIIEKKEVGNEWVNYYVKVTYSDPKDCYIKESREITTKITKTKIKELIVSFIYTKKYDSIKVDSTEFLRILSSF